MYPSRLASRFGAGFRSFRQDRPMTDDELRQVAPSIFADAAHESRSAKYAYIPTSDILAGLRAEGFQPFMAAQARVRDDAHRDFTKNMIRLRHANHINEKAANEIILLNSHNGASSYQMLAGVFRFACANGMICGDTFHDIRVPHKGNIKDQVLDGANVILESFDLITQSRERMESLTLSTEERQAFADAALQLRYDNADHVPIQAEQLIRPRRQADTGRDLWTTFNVAQENIMRGGLHGRNAKNRPTSTRAISGLDQNTALNRALWTLTERMAELKS
ncbi:DUF932 domain-containing protein [Bordetella sp. FB-8]|uniref:DUF932 domain-containing protein n=1 Tax=Bordetella sp. FB-8 TaxID=1159870 RepID=UPI00036D3085|nr:DUF932 domain-containing protein [Bordetella sp. FB-8]